VRFEEILGECGDMCGRGGIDDQVLCVDGRNEGGWSSGEPEFEPQVGWRSGFWRRDEERLLKSGELRG
jgi:hypothetical protein